MLDRLNLFGWQHILLLAVTLTGGVLLWLYRDKLKTWRHRETVRVTMAWVLLLNMAAYYAMLWIKGTFDWRLNLPFHLCFLTNFLMIYVLMTGNRRLFQLVYFFTWIGPLPAMLWPNTPVQFDSFLAYNFFISHHLMLLTGLYCLYVLDYTVERRDAFRAFLFGNAIFLCIFTFNSVFGTNYIMTTELPAHILALFPILKYLNYPILWLELCGIAGIYAAYLLAHWYNGSERRRLAIATVQSAAG